MEAEEEVEVEADGDVEVEVEERLWCSVYRRFLPRGFSHGLPG